MNTFTDAERAELVAIGKRMDAAAKLMGSPTQSRKQPSKVVSGLVPDGDVRLTANIKEALHLKLKIEAAKRRTTIGELLEELIERHL